MNQTPAAILVLASAAFGHAAITTSASAQTQPSIILTLCALGLGIWGVISLIAACIRERELLIDSHARLDVLDRVMVREPLRALKEVARPSSVRYDSRRPLEISPDAHSRLASAARAEGRDRSEILDEMLRQNLPDYDQSRVA